MSPVSGELVAGRDGDRFRRGWLRVGVIVVLVLAVLWSCSSLLVGAEVLDLKVYLDGGRAILAGHDLYGQSVGVRGYRFTYPPFAALLFALPSQWPLGVAILLMTVVSLASLGTLIWLSAPELVRRLVRPHPGPALLVLTAMVACEPVRTALWNGQIELLLAAMVMLDLIAMRGRRGHGVLVGLAAAIKLTPAIFVVYLLLCRRFREAATACGAFAVATFSAWIVLPHDSTEYWTRKLYSRAGIGDISRASNQSILGLADRLVGATAARPLWVVLIVPTALIGLGMAVRVASSGRASFAIAIVGITGCLISPVSWTHHWVWFVPWIAGLVASTRVRALPARLALGAFLVYLVVTDTLAANMVHVRPLRTLLEIAYPLAVVIAFGFAIGPRVRRTILRGSDNPSESLDHSR